MAAFALSSAVFAGDALTPAVGSGVTGWQTIHNAAGGWTLRCPVGWIPGGSRQIDPRALLLRGPFGCVSSKGGCGFFEIAVLPDAVMNARAYQWSEGRIAGARRAAQAGPRQWFVEGKNAMYSISWRFSKKEAPADIESTLEKIFSTLQFDPLTTSPEKR